MYRISENINIGYYNKISKIFSILYFKKDAYLCLMVAVVQYSVQLHIILQCVEVADSQ